MKKIIIVATVFMAMGSVAMAGEKSGQENVKASANASANPVSNSSASSVSAGGAGGSGGAGGIGVGGAANSYSGTNTGANSQNITFNSPAVPTNTTATITSNTNMSGSYTIKNTPSVSGPPLVSSNDTLTL